VVVLGGYPPMQGGAAPITFGGYPPAVTFGGFPTAFGGYPSYTGGVYTGGSGNVNGGGSLNVTAGGYVRGSTYEGYAWTGTENPSKGSTITPANFSAVPSATQLCVSGTVAADPASGTLAMLGVNLNQGVAGGTGSELTYTPPSGGGVTVSVTNTAGSPLWVQIQSPDATQHWCAILTGSGGTIPLSSFNTKCRDNSGTAYAGQPLQTVMILVPGNATAVPFNFCLNALSI
jgi:hypothetical protein